MIGDGMITNTHDVWYMLTFDEDIVDDLYFDTLDEAKDHLITTAKDDDYDNRVNQYEVIQCKRVLRVKTIHSLAFEETTVSAD